MPSVVSNSLIRATPEDCFDLSQSKPLRHTWDPFIKEQRLINAEVPADGVRTWTRSHHGLEMTSEYVSFRRPGVVAMRMVEGPWFFTLFAASWRFAARDDGHTDATWKYRFEVRSWMAPVARPIGVRVLGRDIDNRLEAFRVAAENPELLERLHNE